MSTTEIDLPKTEPLIEPTLDGLLAILSSRTLKSILSDFTSINLEYFNDNVNAYWSKVVAARARLLNELHREYVSCYDDIAAEHIEKNEWDQACEWVAVNDTNFEQADYEYTLRDLTPYIGRAIYPIRENGND
jgi:hypothetical protein